MAPTLRRKSTSTSTPKGQKEVPKTPLYKMSDKVLCKFNDQLYDAIVLEVKHVDSFKTDENMEKKSAIKGEGEEEKSDEDEPPTFRTMSDEDGTSGGDGYPDNFAYFLHYKNWNSTWDEWVRSDCIVPISVESREKQKDLKLNARKEKLSKKYSKKKRRRYRRKAVLSQSGEGDSDATQTQTTMDDDGKFDSCNFENDHQDQISEIDPPEMEVQEDETKSQSSIEAAREVNLEEEEKQEKEDTKCEIQVANEAIQEKQEAAVPSSPDHLDALTVNDFLIELDSYLSSIDTIGTVLASAFVEKLGASFESYYRALLENYESYEQLAFESGSNSVGNTVHFTELSKMIDMIGSGKWPILRIAMSSERISEELEDLEMISTICKEYISATKKFLQSERFGRFARKEEN